MKITKHFLGLPGISTGLSSHFQTDSGLRGFDVNALNSGQRDRLPTPRQDEGYLICNRIYDLLVAGLALVMLFPLLLGIAVAIKVTSKGPVFFRQERYGLNGETFLIYKFRTMAIDACDATGVRQTVKNDPRITSVGHFLRRSNLDELPQLLNILKGEMSVVGPRPHVPGMLADGQLYETFDPRYMLRHAVKPGLTGLAQVKGFRGETTSAQAARMRLKYDLRYVQQQSVPLNIRITVQTFFKEMFGGSGY